MIQKKERGKSIYNLKIHTKVVYWSIILSFPSFIRINPILRLFSTSFGHFRVIFDLNLNTLRRAKAKRKQKEAEEALAKQRTVNIRKNHFLEE